MAKSFLFFEDLKAVGQVFVKILMKYSPPFEIEPHLISVSVE